MSAPEGQGLVPPALTPEEWRQVEGRGIKSVRLLDEIKDQRGPAAALHADAALSLNGQPFGFTWEDVDRVIILAERDEEVAALQWVRQYRSGWRDLGERIAALLPPRIAAVQADSVDRDILSI
jgi:hypothetical protein